LAASISAALCFSNALEPLRRVNAAGTHLLGLINEVLDLSKIEAGKLELNAEPVDLPRLIDEVVGTAGQLAGARSGFPAPIDAGSAPRKQAVPAARSWKKEREATQVRQPPRTIGIFYWPSTAYLRKVAYFSPILSAS
jgi:signal transduction histidine kinase